jgi:putative hydrolase of HD superfamily
VREAVDEYESAESPEALYARDADKLEMLLQAVEYRDIGVKNVDEWIVSATKSLQTDLARRVAEAALTLSSLSWRVR